MGGIVGVFRRGGASVDRALLVKQTELLAHRGPDDGAVYLEGPFALGHRRSDTEGRGHQPHWDGEGRVAVIIDGELEDLSGLKATLESRGHRVPGTDPAAVVLAAYREWGDGAVERLSGAFALAILDRQARHLLLARDRLGQRPLYFHVDARRFVFASELQALLVDPGVPRLLEPALVADWFQTGFVREPGALLQEVRAVGPGETLFVDEERVRIRRYWKPAPVASAVERAADHLRERFDAAANRPSGQPWVAFSGGRVSSALAQWRRRQGNRVRTFTVPGLGPQDGQDSLRLADELELDHSEAPFDLEPVAVLRSALEAMDLPIADAAFIGHVAWARSAGAVLPEGDSLLSGLGGRYLLEGALSASLRPSSFGSSGLIPAFFRGLEVETSKAEAASKVSVLASRDLRVADRLTDVAGRPIDLVFVRPDLVESVLSVARAGVHWGQLTRSVLPSRINAQPGRDPTPPLAEWMRGAVNRVVEGYLFDRPGGASGLLDTPKIRRWWYEHQLGLFDRSHALWRLLVFEYWYRVAIEGENPMPERRRRRRRRGGERLSAM